MASERTRQQTQTVCLMILTAIAVTAALYWLRPVMIPLTLGLLIHFCLAPLISIQQRTFGWHRLIAVSNTVLIAIVLLALIWIMGMAMVSAIGANFDNYRGSLETLMQRLSNFGNMGEDIKVQIDAFLSNENNQLSNLVSMALSEATGILSNLFLVVMIVAFLLAGRGEDSHLKNKGSIFSEVVESIQNYMVTKLMISVATGVAHGAVLWICGVDFAIAFGILAIVLNFIPNIGPIIAWGLPLPIILLSMLGSPPSPEGVDAATAAAEATGASLSVFSGVMAILLSGAVQMGSGSVVEPRIMGNSLDLHPVTVLLALIFFGMLWGITGMFLSAPLTAVVKIICARFELTSSIADLLAGRMDRLAHKGLTVEVDALPKETSTKQELDKGIGS